MHNPNEAVEEYLETLYRLCEEGEGASTGHVADYMGVAPASASEMLKRLESEGYVQRDGRDIVLTARGRELGNTLLRRHRLAERLLTDILGLPWTHVHEQACRLEHVISPEMEEAISSRIADSGTCPHGLPIPRPGEPASRSYAEPLTQQKPGQELVLVSVPEEDEALLNYLDELGLCPGARFTLTSLEPFNGPLHIILNGKPKVLGCEVAAVLRVRTHSLSAQ